MSASGPRKGLLGGTFDPPHVAHLIVAQEVREALELDVIVLIPAHVHAFKGGSSVEPRHRAAMLDLAAAGDPRLLVDRLELQRGGTSYTVETLRVLRQREPDAEWYLVVGADIVPELPAWKSAAELPELARVVVVTRGDRAVAGPLPYPGRSTLVRVPDLEISSTAIRERVAAGHSIRYWVPAAVEAYIREHGLYRTAVPPASIERTPPGG